jgi:hypothetical protein
MALAQTPRVIASFCSFWSSQDEEPLRVEYLDHRVRHLSGIFGLIFALIDRS